MLPAQADQSGTSLGLMAEASRGGVEEWSGASGRGGVWRARQPGKEVQVAALQNLLQIKQPFFSLVFPALYSKSSNCIIFHGPALLPVCQAGAINQTPGEERDFKTWALITHLSPHSSAPSHLWDAVTVRASDSSSLGRGPCQWKMKLQSPGD